MPKTLLAVDDSATMRKVLEITFSGEDFNVVTADGQKDALSKLAERPSVVVIDTVLGGDDGYALSREVRKRDPGAAIILLSSRYNPYDAARGKEAGADDFMDKPFDTQQMLDKVRKAMLSREGSTASPPAAAAQAAQPRVAAQPAAKAADKQRTHTLAFGDDKPPARAPAPEPRAQPAPAPAAQVRAREPQREAPREREREPQPDIASSVNVQLAGRLGDLGLSQSQIDAVMALSRDVVERVVWEVVPQLAEVMIKEEIARLTR